MGRLACSASGAACIDTAAGAVLAAARCCASTGAQAAVKSASTGSQPRMPSAASRSANF
ncbi:Uncharacterised protein [Bordetella pertussis]|nr:Uncharacterised protein [Bordetella pertussis]